MSAAGMSASGGAGRTPFVAGNWKMHKTGAEAKAFVDDLLPLLPSGADVDVAICPPFTALASTLHSVRESGIGVFAQNMHYETHGAFTGEVAPTMLTAVGVTGAIVGHSERRELFGETD